MADIFVTGSTGFLGKCVVWAIEHCGHNAHCYTGRLADLLPRSIQADCIVHMAAALSNMPEDIYSTNVQGTQRLLAAIDGPTHVVFMSSRAVYGDYVPIRYVNEDAPLLPVSEYGRSKVLGEALIRESSHPYTILRASVLCGYGMGKSGNSFVTRIVDQACAGRPIRILGGDQLVDPLYVWDLAQQIAKFCGSAPPWNTVYNSAGPVLQLRSVVAELIRELSAQGIAHNIQVQPNHKASGVVLNTERLARATGRLPHTPLKIILQELVESTRHG